MRVLVTGGSGFIGTNLTERFYNEAIPFCNLDLVPPKVDALSPFWQQCDILNFDDLVSAFIQFKPNVVIHLAAETDTDPSKALSDYKVNTEGSLNVILASQKVDSVERFVLTSTQFVNQSVDGPKHDEDYYPHTIYGESKIISEQYLRGSELKAAWTIIRPTNIWGPWHLRYPFEFWRIIGEGKYFHPGNQPVIRSYGYVGNVVDQILTIIRKSRDEIANKVYYVGDPPINLYDWVNGFSMGQTGKKVRVVPRVVVYSLAILGDLLKYLKVRFPITTSRYKSMTTDNPAFMGKTFDELGNPKYTLQEGINQTIVWLKEKHPNLVKV